MFGRTSTSAGHQCIHVNLHALIQFIRPGRAGLLAQLALRSWRWSFDFARRLASSKFQFEDGAAGRGIRGIGLVHRGVVDSFAYIDWIDRIGIYQFTCSILVARRDIYTSSIR